MNTQQTKEEREMLSALMDGQLHGAAFAAAVERLADDADARADWHCFHVVGDVLRSPELAASAGDSAFLARFQARLAQEPGFSRPDTLPEMAPQTVSQPAVQEAYVPVAATAGVVRLPTAAMPTEDRAANQGSFRWKLVAGFASLAAVSAIGWNMLSLSGQGLNAPANGAQLAQAVEPGRAVSPIQLASAALSVPQAPGPVLVSAEAVAPAIPSEQAQAPVLAAATVAQAGPTTQVVTLPSGKSQVMLRDPRLDALLAAHKQFGSTSALQTPAPFLREATFEGPTQ